MANGLEFPKWDGTDWPGFLGQMHAWAVAHARERISWYQRKRGPKKGGSQWLRALSILFAAAGALCPLLDAAKVGGDRVALGQWGYVALAAAGALVWYDRYFGLSSGWMRYMVTELALETALKEFQFDWAALLARQRGRQPHASDGVLFLEKAKSFTLQVANLVRQETDAWILEFQSNIAGLEKMLRVESEARKPGAIKVSVPNARDFDRVAIRLNDAQIAELAGVTEALLGSVPPGRYEVTAVGQKGDKDRRAGKAVEVPANGVVSVELILPPP